MKENFCLAVMKQVDCSAANVHTHSANLQTGHGFKFPETRQDKDIFSSLYLTPNLRRKLKRLNFKLHHVKRMFKHRRPMDQKNRGVQDVTYIKVLTLTRLYSIMIGQTDG
jgi:hypothetical protein